jgi:alpha,alpha-trehalase
MINHIKYLLFFLLSFNLWDCTNVKTPLVTNEDCLIYPIKDYGELFTSVQTGAVFNDSKRFVDCIPLISLDSILLVFNDQKIQDTFDLKKFVGRYFDTLTFIGEEYNTNPNHTIVEHIDTLWRILTRQPGKQTRSTLIALKNPYIVPGGRFNEIYYWDSYFTMLGLEVSNKKELVKNMVDNFTYLINTFGHIPNGNRSYYLSRSQPPYYSLMVQLLMNIEGKDSIVKYLPVLEKEYNFWMKGKDSLSRDENAYARVVMLDDSTILNRYWDNLNLPRPESYKEDNETFKRSKRDSNIFRDLRAAAESGWDFSIRWIEDKKNIETINTTQIIPVDLNCLLYNLEITIADGYASKRDTAAYLYYAYAEKRKKSIIRYLWSEQKKYFFDFNYKKSYHTDVFSLAAMYPLFFEIADSIQALYTKERIKTDFLFEGGLVSTLTNSGQQWDYPNGWAPLQWISYKGLSNYGYDNLANEIVIRWKRLNEQVFYGYSDKDKKGKMLEKYNVVSTSDGGRGEYPLQDGFGWTNGVYLKFRSILE